MPIQLPYILSQINPVNLPIARDSSGDVIGKVLSSQVLDENFARLANAINVSATEPPKRFIGMIWLDTNDNNVRMWRGNEWITVGDGGGEQLRGFNDPIDLTNATTDYFLKKGEVAIIKVEETVEKPLRIATTSGTAYTMWTVPFTPINEPASEGTINIYPNNTIYYNVFITFGINTYYRGQVYAGVTIQNWFYLSVSSFAIIYNFTQSKKMYSIFTDTVVDPFIRIQVVGWHDTTTAWTSLGTIGCNSAAKFWVIVHRIL